MSSIKCLNLDQSKILLSGNGLSIGGHLIIFSGFERDCERGARWDCLQIDLPGIWRGCC